MFLRGLGPFLLEDVMNCDYTPAGRFAEMRRLMWENTLGYNYVMASKDQKKKMRNQYAKTLGTTPGEVNVNIECKTFPYSGISTGTTSSLDCCVPAVPTVISADPWEGLRKKKTKKEEQAMNAYASAAMINQAANPDADKITHMINRLEKIYRAKDKEATITFGFNDDAAPKSPKELVERIKAGNFKFEDTRELTQDGEWTNSPDGYHGNAINYIEWRTKPVDREGYDAWVKKAKALKQEVEDTIRILTPAEGLVALQRFEGQTIN